MQSLDATDLQAGNLPMKKIANGSLSQLKKIWGNLYDDCYFKQMKTQTDIARANKCAS